MDLPTQLQKLQKNYLKTHQTMTKAIIVTIDPINEILQQM